MELSQAIKGRRSMRRFKPDPVPGELIEKTLELAQWAPSAMNRQEIEINALMGMEGRKLVCLIPLGYPDEAPNAPPRREGRVQWI